MERLSRFSDDVIAELAMMAKIYEPTEDLVRVTLHFPAAVANLIIDVAKLSEADPADVAGRLIFGAASSIASVPNFKSFIADAASRLINSPALDVVDAIVDARLADGSVTDAATLIVALALFTESVNTIPETEH